MSAAPPFGWEQPYASRRSPVLAADVVATSQPLAVQAGMAAFERGGNAVDAALAAAITLTVVEPTNNGIGADAFAIVWDGSHLHGLNGSGRSPAALDPSVFASLESMPLVGWDAVTVPGAVALWRSLSERFGALPFEALFEAAIRHAGDGFLVAPVVAEQWAAIAPLYAEIDDFGRSFLPDGRPPVAGELFRPRGLAATLERIAATRGRDLYEGELAGHIVAHAERGGAALSAEDLAAHETLWVEPVAVDYRGLRLHELPPNGQGLAALMALAILARFDLAELGPSSAEAVHLQIEAMKLALADATRYVADPAAMDVDVDALLDDAYTADRARLIDRGKATDFAHGVPTRGDTVYLTTAGRDGMMVSFIQSNYLAFGSGVVVPGTGISMQNRGACFSLEAGHPNRVGPSKRPFHTIIPAFVTKDGEPVMSFGVMGGPMQPQGHVQVLVRVADFGENPQAAIDAPRWQVERGLEVAVEPAFDPRVRDELVAMGHRIRELEPRWFGGAQSIWRLPAGYLAASDPRKDGHAAGR